jgi:hypothetical protein
VGADGVRTEVVRTENEPGAISGEEDSDSVLTKQSFWSDYSHMERMESALYVCIAILALSLLSSAVRRWRRGRL